MEHPIEELMKTTLQHLREMMNVNTIIGQTVLMEDGTVLIPVSKVSVGFLSGGGDSTKVPAPFMHKETYPFTGGTGAGISIQPVAFLVAEKGKMHLLSLDSQTPLGKLVEMIPGLMQDLRELSQNKKNASTSKPAWN